MPHGARWTLALPARTSVATGAGTFRAAKLAELDTAIESAIDADQWKVIAWFPHVKVRTLTMEELQQYDPAGLAFWNVNTPEEWACCQE